MDDCNTNRVVTLVDMDCFYCQVEVQHDQSLVGKPVAVVQYNSWRVGGIIAVNYEAREKGVNRNMRGDEAIQKCPDLNIVRVIERNGKADLTKYRTASQKVFEVLNEFSSCVQQASIDEAYIDLTSLVNDHISSNFNSITEVDLVNTFVEGYSNLKKDRKEVMKSFLNDVYNNEFQDNCLLRLTIGAMMVEKLRESIFRKTGFRCSAGIANNKILAKLACSLHKPNQQTLLSLSSVPNLFKTIPINKIRNLGGKLGNRVKEEFNCTFVSDLAAITLNDLQKKFDDKTSNFLYQISRGIDNEPVESRIIPKSIGSCKSFPLGLKNKNEIQNWLSILMKDVFDKLEVDCKKNKRKATLMIISLRYINNEKNLQTSQSHKIITYDINKLLDSAYSALCTMTGNQNSLNWKNPISFLGLSIGKFIKINTKSSINNYFNKKLISEERDSNTQLYNTEKDKSSFEIQDRIEKNSFLLSNDEKLSSYNANTTTTTTTTTTTNHNNNLVDSIVIESKLIKTTNKEQINQTNFNKNSFFSKKLETISPVKSQVTLDSIPIQQELPSISSKSSISFFSKKLEIISPSKNIQNNNVQLNTKPVDTTSLKYISPLKDQINHNLISESIIKCSDIDKPDDFPLNVLCDKCNKMIDINEYDVHIDNHFAIELSKSLNDINTTSIMNNKTLKKTVATESKNKSNSILKKRKHRSKTSGSNPKKSCTSISSYFKPV